ncbi:hypothetical protein NMY22_g4108 [Coprinellus aureogranulatus]|nr:hypothetical protein NMY22_g4108 [Coprinellus aureogranulatus]
MDKVHDCLDRLADEMTRAMGIGAYFPSHPISSTSQHPQGQVLLAPLEDKRTLIGSHTITLLTVGSRSKMATSQFPDDSNIPRFDTPRKDKVEREMPVPSPVESSPTLSLSHFELPSPMDWGRVKQEVDQILVKSKERRAPLADAKQPPSPPERRPNIANDGPEGKDAAGTFYQESILIVMGTHAPPGMAAKNSGQEEGTHIVNTVGQDPTLSQVVLTTDDAMTNTLNALLGLRAADPEAQKLSLQGDYHLSSFFAHDRLPQLTLNPSPEFAKNVPLKALDDIETQGFDVQVARMEIQLPKISGSSNCHRPRTPMRPTGQFRKRVLTTESTGRQPEGSCRTFTFSGTPKITEKQKTQYRAD